MLTPMRRQYLDVKTENPDAIVLVVQGDTFQAFGDDARIVAKVCGVELLSFQVEKGSLPFAGFSQGVAKAKIARLIAAGHRVAIIDPPK